MHPNDVPRRCKIDNWSSSGADYGVQIVCTDPTGTPVDTLFTMSYHFRRSVVGTQPSSFAYMTNLVGAPTGSDFNSLIAPNLFTGVSPGRYVMQYLGVGIGATHMQVTALAGPPGYYCQLENIWVVTGDVLAPLICFNNVGIPTDNLLFATFSSHL